MKPLSPSNPWHSGLRSRMDAKRDLINRMWVHAPYQEQWQACGVRNRR